LRHIPSRGGRRDGGAARDLSAPWVVVIGDPVALAEVLVRLAHSLLLAPHLEPALRSRAEVAEYARRYILPLTRSAAVPI
jgi:hypothetical protein